MNYIAERRLEEKERRRADILNAAEDVAAAVGWSDMTMDQVARKARLSRALLYVYFQDKMDLMFGVNERALILLHQMSIEAAARHSRGIDQVASIGRAYASLAQEHPVYFDVFSRCELTSIDAMEPSSNYDACLQASDGVFDVIGKALEQGIEDGTVRPDIGPPRLVAMTLWGFMHGIIQVATNKASVLQHHNVTAEMMTEKALDLSMRSLALPKKSDRKSR